MIKKINFIKNLASFKNFSWDNNVVDSNEKKFHFEKINIIYGRNYSGKTTLSRIFRAIEKGSMPDNYDNPEFELITKEPEQKINHNNLSTFDKKVRVFNTDFVKEKLSFIYSDDKDVEAFAILADKADLAEIDELKQKLGSDEKDKETGLYCELSKQEKTHKSKIDELEKKKSDLEGILRNKATNRESGIKYRSDEFGDQNYTVVKLKNDIAKVLKEGYEKITKEKVSTLKALIQQNPKEKIVISAEKSLQIDTFSDKAKELINTELVQVDKIKNLLDNYQLNNWVETGITLHKNEQVCAFCDNKITENRWQKLNNHFDESSKNLKNSIVALINDIDEDIKELSNTEKLNKDAFYSEFHNKLTEYSKDFKIAIDEYIQQLKSLKAQLEQRRDNIFNTSEFNPVSNDVCQKIKDAIKNINDIIEESNNYSKDLEKKQSSAKEELRLNAVYIFTIDIGYCEKIQTIELLKGEASTEEQKLISIKGDIEDLKKEISKKETDLQDETKGALKINEYLNSFNKNDLKLEPIKTENDVEPNKKIKFEILRNNKKAFNLSEGESGLIAFCYFMAKLEDTETKGTKPIIWIDDPISSLDDNHIFFVYSLINAKLFGNGDNFGQLFISTHNLNFFKFLKRLKQPENTNRGHFIVENGFCGSAIKLMPKYLKEYVTEFNYLFNQIYKCSEIKSTDDDNYSYLYNFPNNARKFLEILLYYKYPDLTKENEKMKRFFGDDIPSLITERVENEYSHLCGALERGANIIEYPAEIIQVAKALMNKLQENDKDQFEALKRSIGA